MMRTFCGVIGEDGPASGHGNLSNSTPPLKGRGDGAYARLLARLVCDAFHCPRDW